MWPQLFCQFREFFQTGQETKCDISRSFHQRFCDSTCFTLEFTVRLTKSFSVAHREAFMSVGTFDPNQLHAQAKPIDGQLRQQAVEIAQRQATGAGQLDLSDDEVSDLQPLLTHSGWFEAAQELSMADVVGLIRLFTLGEGQFSGWQAGAKSPVVALAKTLKQRREMTPELTAWIKQNTDNRYLPHGDLMDRL